MENENFTREDLLNQIKILNEQNRKLKITSEYFKMKYEEDMAGWKKETDDLLKNISEESTFKYHYEHPMVSATADAVIFGYDRAKKSLMILLIKRGEDPIEYSGFWALPGGFLQQNIEGREDEDLQECVERELKEETGYKCIAKPEQFHTYSAPKRDPRNRVITTAFLALVLLNNKEEEDETYTTEIKGGSDAKEARWFPVYHKNKEGEEELLKDIDLAFDHRVIIQDALEALRCKVFFEPIVYKLLGDKFTISEVQDLFETILHTTFDRRNFKKKITGSTLFLNKTDETITTSNGRIANIYTFNKEKYDEYKNVKLKLEF